MQREPTSDVDFVEYRIFTKEQRLESLAEELQRYLQENFIKDYIWQQEPFRLAVCSDRSSEYPPHIGGSTKFGDNIEDEWFIVFLLSRLSRQYPELTISVRDNDGEFLLIEAALHIPKWLNPQNSKNRVWIKNGQLHIIPPPGNFDVKLYEVPQLSVNDALAWMDTPEKCARSLAPPAVQNAILERIKKYPEYAYETSHQWVKCKMPINAAYILRKHPHLVAPAVVAFYNRDPIQLKDAMKMKRLGTSPSVMTMVRFTRCLYAQLKHQQFFPPLAFGLVDKTDPNFPAFETGSKLAVGLEILYHDSKRKRLHARAEMMLPSYNFQEDEGWIDYRKRLEESGYFKNASEGTSLFRSLEKRAKLKFLESLPDEKFPQSLEQPANKTFDQIIEETLNGLTLSPDQFPDSDLFPETPSDWMNVSPEEVDEIIAAKEKELDEYYNKYTKKAKKAEETGKNDEKLPEDNIFDSMVNNMREFMKKVSDLEGVELGEEDNVEKLVGAMQKSLKTLARKRKEGTQSDDSSEEDDDFYAMGTDEDEEDEGDMYEVDPETQERELTLRGVMAQMDRELRKTTLGATYEVAPKPSKSAAAQAKPVDEDDLPPIDVNLTLVKNFLDSLSAQEGLPGPVSNLLKEMSQSKTL